MDQNIKLEAILGFNGHSNNVLKIIQHEGSSHMVYAIGGLLVLENIVSKKQKYLKLHDNEITALSISPRANLVATGQLGSVYSKTPIAPIRLVNPANMEVIHTFTGINDGVLRLEFSPDGKFLAASGKDGRFMIWNMDDLTVVVSVMDLNPITQMFWSFVQQGQKFPSYQLASTDNLHVSYHNLDFQLGSMKYQVSNGTLQMPNSGLNRIYMSNTVDKTTGYYYLGTKGGELCAFDLNSKLFKAAIQVGNSALTNLLLQDATIYAGFYNGYVRVLNGKFDKWQITKEIRVNAHITSLSFDITSLCLFAGTNNAEIYMFDSQLSRAKLFSSGHKSEVIDADGSENIFATIEKAGITKIWKDGQLIKEIPPKGLSSVPEGRAVCISAKTEEIVSGYSNGNINCFNFEGLERWEILNSHKGGVSTIYMDNLYIISSGYDGIVRIWNRTHRNLITQINIHEKKITRCLVDIEKPHIIHTCSLDKEIISYDIKLEKKIKQHSVKNGFIYDMAQKKSPEYELITCGFNNPVSFWDIDVTEPTSIIPLHERALTIGISQNGNYFAVGTDKNEIYVFDTNTRQLINKLTGHSAPILKLRWLNNHKFITCSADGSICIWSI